MEISLEKRLFPTSPFSFNSCTLGDLSLRRQGVVAALLVVWQCYLQISIVFFPLSSPRPERDTRGENPPFITITAFSALQLPN